MVEQLVNELKNPAWISEVTKVELLYEELKKSNQEVSVRILGDLINKSKSWVSVSLELARGLRVFDELRTIENRIEAYNFLLKKKKFRRFLES